jgi:hypothetical protein
MMDIITQIMSTVLRILILNYILTEPSLVRAMIGGRLPWLGPRFMPLGTERQPERMLGPECCGVLFQNLTDHWG